MGCALRAVGFLFEFHVGFVPLPRLALLSSDCVSSGFLVRSQSVREDN